MIIFYLLKTQKELSKSLKTRINKGGYFKIKRVFVILLQATPYMIQFLLLFFGYNLYKQAFHHQILSAHGSSNVLSSATNSLSNEILTNNPRPFVNQIYFQFYKLVC